MCWSALKIPAQTNTSKQVRSQWGMMFFIIPKGRQSRCVAMAKVWWERSNPYGCPPTGRKLDPPAADRDFFWGRTTARQWQILICREHRVGAQHGGCNARGYGALSD